MGAGGENGKVTVPAGLYCIGSAENHQGSAYRYQWIYNYKG